jgi:hypothetical protein
MPRPNGRAARRVVLLGLTALCALGGPGAVTSAQADLTDSYPSNDCASGAAPGLLVVDGWVQNNYHVLRTAKDPLDPKNNWICFAVENRTGGAYTHFGRKLVVRTPSGSPAGVDNNWQACETTGTEVFTEHGQVGDVPFDIWVRRVPGGLQGQIWVCVNVNGGQVAKRITIDTDLTAVPTISEDPNVNHPVQYASPFPPFGYPSWLCQGSSFHVRHLNLGVGNYRVWLYTWAEGPNRMNVCFRAQSSDPSLPAAGGRLTLDTNGLIAHSVDFSSDFTPCAERNILTLSNPPIQLTTTNPGSRPAWVCVQAGSTHVRVMLDALSGGGPPAQLTLDP